MNKNRLKREHAGNENDLNEVEKSDANLGQKAKFSILGVRFFNTFGYIICYDYC